MKSFLSFTFIFVLCLGQAFGAHIRASDDNLTQVHASERKAQVKSVAYVLHFDFKKQSKTFSAKSLIQLELSHTNTPLSLDLLDKKVISVTVNGKEIKRYPMRKGSLDIPQKYLSHKTNIEIVYNGAFSKGSEGLLKSIDPEDGSEYIYTDFEPYAAHHLFPCLNQPDLKASFLVTVTAPQDWKVIHNELIDTSKAEGDTKTVTFLATPPISTYLFFLGTGPFVEWKDSTGKIPLSIYARKTLEKYVDHERLFKTTKKGLEFFNSYFNYPYPFSKYSQIFIPEFAWGGMENPGAVTLNERNIFRGPVTDSIYEKRDSLILHEMAHMWFGDLVTMEWWNDLWLNESFATYLASIAQDRTMDSKGTWISFFGAKSWGYWQDQLVSTHPIETVIPDARAARGNFDGITYGKGASALKQLHFFVGEEGFKKGLQSYFETYAFKNAQRKDFIDSIAVKSQINLSDWTAKWLQTAGPNRVSVDFSCDDGKVKTFTLKQSPSVSKTLSPHRTRLGLFQSTKAAMKQTHAIDVFYSTETTDVKEALGENCPDFVLPNLDDQDYALYSLDAKSLGKAADAMLNLPDPLSRMLIWNILGEMVRDQKLKPQVYMEMVMIGLEKESDDLLLGNLMGRFNTIRSQYFLFLSPQVRAQLAPKMESVLLKRLELAKPGSSLQMNFFDFFVSMAQTLEAQKILGDYLKDVNPPQGIVLGQDRRWMLLSNLASNGYPHAKNLIDEELKRDPSTLGQRMAYALTAALPDLVTKKKYWKEFFGKEKLPYSNFRESAYRFHGPNYEELSQSFAKDFFKKILMIDWKKHDDDVEVFFEELYPVQLCSPDILKLSQSSLLKARKLTTLAKRSWLEAQDELSRCIRVRSLEL